MGATDPIGAMQTLAGLNRRFGIQAVAEVVEGTGALPKVRIATQACAAEIYLHGAHVTSWKPRGADEVLFLSSHSRFQDGQAIRGGVPICFPWFRAKVDDPKAPSHGFVRTKSWQLESIVLDGDAVTVRMVTKSDESTREWWPAEFQLVHRATFGSDLTQELLVTNTGDGSLRFEESLHSYFRVADVRNVRVLGLDGVRYLDNTDSNREKFQQGEIEFNSETDRAYLNTRHPLELEDASLRRRIRVVKENSRTTVAWNPWAQKAGAMTDLGDEWTRMTCIETSNVRDFAVNLPPGQQHKMTAIISVDGL